MNIYRFLITLPTILMLLFAPMQTDGKLVQPLQAQGNSCVTSSPTPATYTVKLCFTTPQDNSQITGNVTVTVTAAITGKTPGVQRMVYYLNGAYFLTDYQSPFTFTLPSAHWTDGSYTLSVEAMMHSGFTTPRASLTLNFANGIETPPVNTNQFHPTSGTTPPIGSPFVVVATGDGAGGEVNGNNVVKLIASLNPNLFLYLGDVYEKGTYPEFYNYYGSQGADFSQFKSITDPTVGNHEYTSGSAQDYFYYWDNIPNYYSFDAGGWHFVSLNSNGSYVSDASNSPQYLWLAADLSAHSQACTIVYYHEPLFNVGQERPATQMASIWALLAQHHVTIVLNGHDHDYQHWMPLDGQGKPDPNGITEFVAGGGGHGLQTISKTDSRVAYSNSSNPQAFGALRFALSANSASFSYVDIAGTTLDSGVIACQKSTLDTPPPSVPVGVSVTIVNPNQVEISWSASTGNAGISGYGIYRDGVLLATVPGTNLTYTDATAKPGVSYTYTVDAFDSSGNKSAVSAPAVGTSDMPVSCH
jgi:hypothetical protein